MSEHASSLPTLHRQRLRALVIPREHGAWGLLLVPLLTGAAAGLIEGGQVIPVLLLAVAALALFWLRTPVESWLGTAPIRVQSDVEKRAVLQFAFILAVISATALGALFWGGQNTYLFLLGAISGLAFALQAFLKVAGRRTRMLAQVVGAIGLTCTAPAAYYVATAHIGGTGWILWLANWLFAGNQIHFVQVRIHSARAASGTEKLSRGRFFLIGQGALTALLLAIWRFGLLPSLAMLAFVPVIGRGTAWFFAKPAPLAVRRLGWTEVAYSISFGILFVLGLCAIR
jgi:hypothetical protein